MTRITPLLAADVASVSGSSYPEPLNTQIGNGCWRPLGDPFGLTQFGVNLEEFKPGDQSALRHWHTLSDEFVYVLSGEMTLVTDQGETLMTAGMCAGFKAGARNGHHLVNRSSGLASVLVMGARIPGDNCFYPDDDLLWVSTEDGSHAAHKDGRAYKEG